jgi:hypothetical protein
MPKSIVARFLVVSTVFLGILLGLTSFAFSTTDSMKLNKNNFRRITVGMPKKAVFRVLAMPRHEGKESTRFPLVNFNGLSKAAIWSNDQDRIIVTFNEKNRVSWIRRDKAIQ